MMTQNNCNNTAIPTIPKASKKQIDRVYSDLKKVCPPDDALREVVKKTRGLTDEQIDEFIIGPINNRTIVKEILALGNIQPKDLLGVPGFYLDKTGNEPICPEDIRFVYLPDSQYVIAIRDDDRIIALQSRVRGSNSNSRYLWISSKDRPYGASSGAPMGFVSGKNLLTWKPGQPIRIAVCEGFFKAAAIARTLDVECVLFACGVQNTSSFLDTVLQVTRERPVSILIVPDMDFLTNPNVVRAYAKLAGFALELTKDVSVLAWPTECGKGYDDVLARGFSGCCAVRPVDKFLDALRMVAKRSGDPSLLNYINNCV